MTSNYWWADSLNPSLSQGDIVAEISLLTTTPLQFLQKQTIKVHGDVWIPSENKAIHQGKLHALAHGIDSHAIVLSYSCDLDKTKKNATVLLAPIRSLDSLGLTEDQKITILQQRHYAMLPLPDIPKLGMCVADLRCISYVSRKIIDDLPKIASMQDHGLQRLSAQLVGFFTRLEIPSNLMQTITAE